MSGFEPMLLVRAFGRTREQQLLWAAKGGRGRRKPQPGMAWQSLNPKRGRGRPRKQVAAVAQPSGRSKRRRINYEFDQDIILELIRAAPTEPNKSVRELVRAMVAKREPPLWRRGARTPNKVGDEQDVTRIMRKIRVGLPILLVPHKVHLAMATIA